MMAADVPERILRRQPSPVRACGVHHVAFEDPNSRRVLAVTNPGAERSVRVRLAGGAADVPLLVDSIVTLSRN